MTHRGPCQPQTFWDSVILGPISGVQEPLPSCSTKAQHAEGSGDATAPAQGTDISRLLRGNAGAPRRALHWSSGSWTVLRPTTRRFLSSRRDGRRISCPAPPPPGGLEEIKPRLWVGLSLGSALPPSFSGGEQRGAGPARLPLLTHAAVMMMRAKRQGAIMFHTPLRSSCRDMAISRVPKTKRTWE